MHSVFPILLFVFFTIIYTASCEENDNTNTLSETNIQVERYAREAGNKNNRKKDNKSSKKKKNKELKRKKKKKNKANRKVNKKRSSKKRSGKENKKKGRKSFPAKKEKKKNRKSNKYKNKSGRRQTKQRSDKSKGKNDNKKTGRKKVEKKRKGSVKKKKTSGKTVQLRQSSSTSTCNGTALSSDCLTNLKAAMKYDRDKIANFRNQLQRSKDFNKTIGGKGGKTDLFANSTTYLLIALGGNMSNPNCSGDPSLTANATAAFKTLHNCSKAIGAACEVPKDKVNYTLMESCGKHYKKVQDKNNDCLEMKTNGTAICECWDQANTLTAAAKAVTKKDGCDALGAQSSMKKLKSACLKQFGLCKKAEDASVQYIMVCSGSANLNLNATVSSNSTVSSNGTASSNSTSSTNTNVSNNGTASANATVETNSSTSNNSSSNTANITIT